MSPLTDEQREALNEELRQVMAASPPPRAERVAVRLVAPLMGFGGAGLLFGVLVSCLRHVPAGIAHTAVVAGLVGLACLLASMILMQCAAPNLDRARDVYRRHLGHLTREEQEAYFFSQLKPDSPVMRRVVKQIVRDLNLPAAREFNQPGIDVPLPDEPEWVAGLRKEIRRAGQATYWLRIGMAGGVLVAGLGWVLASGPISIESSFPALLFALAMGGATVGLWLACAAAFPVAAAFNLLRQAQIRRKLAALPPAERAAVLLPLRRGASPEVTDLVRPLIGEFCASEPTPAGPPDGRGDEGLPAG